MKKFFIKNWPIIILWTTLAYFIGNILYTLYKDFNNQ